MSNEIEVRPFSINVPEAALVDLRRRLAATRWPERETVTDQSQGVQLAKIQPLVRYWGIQAELRRPVLITSRQVNCIPLQSSRRRLLHQRENPTALLLAQARLAT
jgi:hypothetical protein